MEILIIITLVACVVSVIISVITLLTQKRLAENIGVNKITDEQTAKQLEMLAERTAQLSAKFDTAQANRVSGESVLRTELVNLVTNLGNTLTDTQSRTPTEQQGCCRSLNSVFRALNRGMPPICRICVTKWRYSLET